MRHIIATAGLLLCAACSTPSFSERYADSLPIEQRMPFEVGTKATTVEIETAADGRLTSRGQSAALGFLQSYTAEGESALGLQLPQGSTGAQTEREIRQLAAIYGIQSSSIRMTASSGDNGPVRLVYAKLAASVPACEKPDWSENLAMTNGNTPYPNFGCAMQKNIAAMASNPVDLLASRPMDANAPAARRSTVLDKFVKGESPSSARTPGDSGKVNDMSSGTQRQ